jgi:hypothetical protein
MPSPESPQNRMTAESNSSIGLSADPLESTADPVIDMNRSLLSSDCLVRELIGEVRIKPIERSAR